MVPDRVLQDALKEQGQFVFGSVAIFFCQTHHTVLHDVQCRFFIAHCVQRLLVGAPLDRFEEGREF